MKRKAFYALVLIKSLTISLVTLAQVTGVEAIGITVKDMDRSVQFYTEVLGFKKISDTGYQGESFEKLQGLFGLNARVVRLQLGHEFIELTDYLTSC
jgi:catechol 2,3-dioxygenase-like lactoylglutathione lyase family enzyme